MEIPIGELLQNSVFRMLYLYWKYATGKIDEKDQQIKDYGDKVLEAFNKNTQSHSDLRDAVSANTKATESLSIRVYDVLTRHDNRNNANNK